jgi:transposase
MAAPTGTGVFQNEDVVIYVIRNSRAARVVADVLDGHRPSIWVSDLYSAQQGHADLWQICLAHQLRDCQYAIEAGDEIFAPRMKTLLLRAVVLARRRMELAESTRRSYQRRLDRDLNATWYWLLQIGTASDCESVTAETEATCSHS